MLFQKLKFQSQKEILNPRVYFQSLTFQSQFGPLNFSQEYSGKKKLAASALLTLEGYTLQTLHAINIEQFNLIEIEWKFWNKGQIQVGNLA